MIPSIRIGSPQFAALTDWPAWLASLKWSVPKLVGLLLHFVIFGQKSGRPPCTNAGIVKVVGLPNQTGQLGA